MISIYSINILLYSCQYSLFPVDRLQTYQEGNRHQAGDACNNLDFAAGLGFGSKTLTIGESVFKSSGPLMNLQVEKVHSVYEWTQEKYDDWDY